MQNFMNNGQWDFCDAIPVTNYLETVENTKKIQFIGGKDEDLFKVQATNYYIHRDQRKNRGGKIVHRKKKQGRVCYVTNNKEPKAVDEDLYKIPPELLRQIPKKKRMLGNFLSGCLGLNCIA